MAPKTSVKSEATLSHGSKRKKRDEDEDEFDGDKGGPHSFTPEEDLVIFDNQHNLDTAAQILGLKVDQIRRRWKKRLLPKIRAAIAAGTVQR